jgi:hypothetical protein
MNIDEQRINLWCDIVAAGRGYEQANRALDAFDRKFSPAKDFREEVSFHEKTAFLREKIDFASQKFIQLQFLLKGIRGYAEKDTKLLEAARELLSE